MSERLHDRNSSPAWEAPRVVAVERLGQGPQDGAGVDAVGIPVVPGEALGEAAAEIDRRWGGLLSSLIDSDEFGGGLGATLMVPVAADGGAVRRVLLYGLGSRREMDGQRLRYAHHELARAARRHGYRRLAVLAGGPLRADDAGAAVEGCVAGSWERRTRRTGPGPVRLEELVVAGAGAERDGELQLARQLGAATAQAREWQHAPANELWPETLADLALAIARRHGATVEVLGPDELEAAGLGLLLGVGRGSARPPRLIRLHHRAGGGRSGGPSLALIGKGITFDAGGLSIKTMDGMTRMRGDMAGAAAVLAAFDVIAGNRWPVDVMAVVAAAENMLGPDAQKPGDVVTSASGATVEILNTDAEGRLVLADALTYAIRHGATHLIDLATLTGTARAAVGHAATAAIGNDDAFWDMVQRAATLAGERVWRLPIYPEYRALLRSRSADLRNSHYGEAGMITGGMFIGEFAQGRPWVHLDIAASTWNVSSRLPGVPYGPLGTGARLCIRLAQLLAQDGAEGAA